MRAPGRADPVVPGQQAVRVFRHVRDGKVAQEKSPDKHRETESDQKKLARGKRRRQAAPDAVDGADMADDAESKGHQEGGDHGKVSDFDDHGATARTPESGGPQASPSTAIPAISGGM